MQVIKVALPGYDVNKAAPDQCAIHSSYDTPKVDATKEHFLNIDIFFQNEPPSILGSTVETILHQEEHDYTYTPQVWLHCDYQVAYSGGSHRYGPGEAFLAVGSTIADTAYIGVRADDTNIYVYIRKAVGTTDPSVIGKSISLRVYIFANEL